jgi:hypothetical protein
VTYVSSAIQEPAYHKKDGEERFYYCPLKDTVTEPEKG